MAATRNNRPSDPVDAVAAVLAPRLAAGAHVCVALSGGRDSVALLHALIELRATRLPALHLSALHVHHGLSPQADAWAAFCLQLCHEHAVPCRCERVTVARDDPSGVEAAARRARYDVFAACDADWLALAHHRDDQAETLLLNLLRGAGAHGLAAMPEARRLGKAGPRLLRPLLQVSRAEIDAWLAARQLAWVEDESNGETALRRNFLRHEVLPLIGRQIAEPARMLARSAAHLADMAQLADELAALDAQDALAGNSLLIAPLMALPMARRRNLLRHFLRLHGVRMPDARHLDEILRQAGEASAAAMPGFVVDGVRLQVTRGCLWLLPQAPATDVCPWHGEAALPWSDGCVRFSAATGEGLAQRALNAAVELRPRRGGETLRPHAGRPRRPLKKWLQEAGIPQWQRDTMPLLWCGDRLLWAAGIGYASDAGVLAEAGEPGWLLSWTRPTTFPAG